ncbi:BACON domain-containing protein [Streptomyces vastus]|uniref:BACON domain-containing protein n=1 Tax=Streptomyces vastus TaxID=285451 RepID=A0ABN3QFU9_9ACTN
MSRSPETTTHTTGAPPAHRAAPDRAAVRTSAQCPPTRYEPYLDGLFTYCLSVLCDHDAAVAALGDALALAERRGPRGVQAADERRAWLYALARWACLRKLAETTDTDRPGNRQANRQAKQAKQAKVAKPGGQKRRGTRASDAEEDRRRRELALLAWPEAAGTTPEQREALELAVRHQLAVREVAAVLGMEPVAVRELLGAAACEVERTRAALAVVETGACPGVARLTGDRLVLSTPLRRELVRHVDDCPRCRRTAERAIPGSWPGTSVTPAALPVLEAPRAALHMAMARAPRARGGSLRFDRRGFPMDPKHHAARRNRLRARAVTTTVVVTVVAAPVLALGAAYRGAPLTGEGSPGRPITANEAHGPGALGGEYADDYENAGSADPKPEPQLSEGVGKGFGEGKGSSEVAVQVIGVASGHQKKGLSVEADSSGDTTLITLRASGGSPVHWSARTGASWLYLSQSSGTLRPGESLTIKVYVDHLREPNGPWSARVSIAPAGAMVSIDGYGTAGPSHPGPGPAPDPTPSAPTPSSPGPTPSDPTPSAPEPTPTSPTPSEPDPTPTPMEATGSPPPPSDGTTPSPQES